ncbi:MAG: tetratricopeptide repeat protein [Limisphaerales bacterium]
MSETKIISLILLLLAACLSKAESSGTNSALPAKPSEEHIQVIADATVANGITKMERAAKLSQYQVALESARGLRKGRELKRAESTLIQLLESSAGEEIKRPALLELGLVMQEQKEYPKAQQLYTEYARRYDKDPSVPEVLLRQAYLYREMGVPILSMTKFYAVISTCLNLQLEELDYYQRLVLRAQAEIAETHFLQGQYEDAIDYFNRLLKLESLDLERANVLYKLVQCYMKLNKHTECLASATLFLEKFPNHLDAPETRYIKVDSLKKLGRNKEAIAELEGLLRSQQAAASADPQQWLYWQQRAGNTIANEFYKEGDLLSAVQIYNTLAEINSTPEWQLPAWYQIGLVYENLKFPQKALEMYGKVVSRTKDVKDPNPNLQSVLEMAAWRKQNIEWEAAAKHANRLLTDIIAPSELVLHTESSE